MPRKSPEPQTPAVMPTPTTYAAQPYLIQAGDLAPVARSVRLPLYTVALVRDRKAPPCPSILDSPQKIAAAVRPLIGNSDREHFLVVLLDARQKCLGLQIVSTGTLSASLVHPRETFKPALLAGAAAIVVCHNHPSGDATPSAEDGEATRRLVKAGELLGVPVLDHVVIGADSHYSFREAGRI